MIESLSPKLLQFEFVGDPSPEDWNRVRRYASWMREVRVDEWIPFEEEIYNKLRLNSPPGGWFPALRDLTLYITKPNPHYAGLFFSPNLKRFSINTEQLWDDFHAPLRFYTTLDPFILMLPTSSLERISVDARHQTMSWEHFKDSFSSVVLRCGPSFTEYNSPVPLSNAALDHLIQLPHLHNWRIHGPPPTYPASSLSPVFPPLREFTLGKGAACGWLSLLGRLEDSAATTQGVTPLSKAKESLKVLNIEDIFCISIDAPFVSTIQCFWNLVKLSIEVYCDNIRRRGQCVFKLNNNNVTELAMALTQLESLLLGRTCLENSCLTTVACLLPVSIHCNKLGKLGIHSNTTSIVDDFKNALEDPRSQQIRSLPRWLLTYLDIFRVPLDLDESGFETVVKGMIVIFPSLKRCEGLGREWNELPEETSELQEDSE